MDFEWDPNKERSNLVKHGVTFREATEVFFDPVAVEFFDEHDSEDRFIRVGTSQSRRILVVVFCEREGDAIRIISARKATKKEKAQYEEGI